MRVPLAAVLIAVLPACAANGGDGGKLQVGDGGKLQVAEPILVARSGPDTLRFVDRSKFEIGPLGFEPIRAWWLFFTFESSDRDAIVTDRSAFECRGTEGSSPAVERGKASGSGQEVILEVPYESALAAARDLEVDLTVFRVEKWTEYETPGLMDASLDEIPCPPFLMRFAGEGESCWLSASMGDDPKPPPGTADPAEVVDLGWVATTVTLTDAKGRALVRTRSEEGPDTALANFSTHADGTPPPPGEPTIQYPVTVRLRIPAKWTTEVKTFRFRGLPLK